MAILNMVGGGGGGLKSTDAILRVIAPAGSTVTISKGGVSKSDLGHENASDTSLYDYYFIVHASQFDSVNPWTVTATDGVDTATDTIIIDSADEYDVELSYKFYLYKSGNEYTSVTGGFEYLAILSGSYSEVAPVKNASSIRLAPSGSSKQSSAVTVNAIDLTDYSTLYVNITEFDRTASGYRDFFVKSSRTSGTTFAGDTQIDNTGVFSIDVSSLSGSYYVGVFCNSSGSSVHCYISFDKIWLE